MSKPRKPRHKDAAPPTGPFGVWLGSLSPLRQDLLCVALLYAVILVLFRGVIFSNSTLSAAPDTAAAAAYIKAGDHIKATEGVDPLWMPYVFSGMPTFGNVAYLPHNISYIQVAALAVLKFLFLNADGAWMIVHYFLGGVFMFLLMRTWGLTRLPALFAALTFMLSPYAIGLASEGHGSKLQALSYLPAVVLLTHLLMERRDLLSFGLFAAGIGTLLLTNHMQIVYYVLAVVFFFLVSRAALDFKTGRSVSLKKMLLVGAGLAVGLLISSYVYLSVYEYSHYSIRGGGAAGMPGGLAWDYATNWSFHPFEMITYLIPSFFGFSSNVPYMFRGQITPLPLYWGTMPFVNSTMYVGLLPVVLSVIALIYRRNRTTVFFAFLTALILLVSFGKHFALLYDLLFTSLPFFNKFRAPSMILQLVAFTTAVMGAYGLAAILETPPDRSPINTGGLKKGILVALGVVWGVLLLGFLFKSGLYNYLSGFMFTREGENYGAQTAQVIAEFKRIRYEVLWNDLVKFTLLATGSLGAIWFYLSRKMTGALFGAAILGILLLDLFIIDARFISPQPKTVVADQFQADATVTFLQREPGLFRIFPVGELFMEKTYAYHLLQSIGGYHPAKLKIYQTMIDSCLYRGTDPSFPLNMKIVNMLNARYLIVPGALPPGLFELVNTDDAKRQYTYRNPGALPRTWFVDRASVAGNDSEVFGMLNAPDFNPATTAVLEKNVAGLTDVRPAGVATAGERSAEVTQYGAHRITVTATTPAPALLVLSEVYYPAGWKAFIDDTETEIFKTNSILRSVQVPAGRHTIEFRFAPAMYGLGWTLSNAAWGLSGICIVGGFWFARRKRAPAPAVEKHDI